MAVEPRAACRRRGHNGGHGRDIDRLQPAFLEDQHAGVEGQGPTTIGPVAQIGLAELATSQVADAEIADPAAVHGAHLARAPHRTEPGLGRQIIDTGAGDRDAATHRCALAAQVDHGGSLRDSGLEGRQGGGGLDHLAAQPPFAILHGEQRRAFDRAEFGGDLIQIVLAKLDMGRRDRGAGAGREVERAVRQPQVAGFLERGVLHRSKAAGHLDLTAGDQAVRGQPVAAGVDAGLRQAAARNLEVEGARAIGVDRAARPVERGFAAAVGADLGRHAEANRHVVARGAEGQGIGGELEARGRLLQGRRRRIVARAGRPQAGPGAARGQRAPQREVQPPVVKGHQPAEVGAGVLQGQIPGLGRGGGDQGGDLAGDHVARRTGPAQIADARLSLDTARLNAGAAQPGGAGLKRAIAGQGQGLEPAGRRAVELGQQLEILHPAIPGAQGRAVEIQPRNDLALAALLLEVGIGSLSREPQIAAGGGHAAGRQILDRGGQQNVDPVAIGDQQELRGTGRGAEPLPLQHRRIEAGVERHQLAVLHPAIGAGGERAIVGGQTDDALADLDPRLRRPGLRRPLGEFLDQRIERAEAEFAALQAGAHDRPVQRDRGDLDPKRPPGPEARKPIVDLNQIGGDVGIALGAHADPRGKAAEFEASELHLGGNAAGLQPADQDLAGDDPAGDIDAGPGHDSDQGHDGQGRAPSPPPASGRPGWRGRIGIGIGQTGRRRLLWVRS